MGHIGDDDRKQLADLFAGFAHPVTMVCFTQEHECQYCSMTREILEELAALSDKLTLEIHDFVRDGELADRYGIDKIPATLLLGDRDYGIRFYGVPAGYEFTTFVEDLADVARRDPGLPDEVRRALEAIDRPVHLQVMISPTCPVCPAAVRQAHRFAMASEQVRADMVETSEFPHLVVKYDVQGVPMTIVNERGALVGELPDMKVIEEIRKVLKKEKKEEKKQQKKKEKKS